MESSQIRKKFLDFFEKRGHAIIPSASLVPENDPSVLFTTAGMQPLVPYLLGQTHPKGKRIANVQKCVRTGDIDEVGDNTHLTFFQMMGNWSLGDYFKKEAIEWSYELLTSKEEGFGLDPQRLYVTVFEGDENAPRDEESYSIWKEIFERNNVSGERIYFMGAKSNWWSAGDNGPCGPDTEMFYDLTGTLNAGLTKEEYLKADEEQKVVEIWNDVFMQYEKKDGKVIGKLKTHNVDTGAGLERITAVLQGVNNVYETDLFREIISSFSDFVDERKKRIIADHIRTSVFLISDGVLPSNKDRGYVLRKLLRRAIFHMRSFEPGMIFTLAGKIIDKYQSAYSLDRESIFPVIKDEQDKFNKTLAQGLAEFEKIVTVYLNKKEFSKDLPSHIVYDLYTTFGFPMELINELAAERGLSINHAEVDELIKKHQDLSRTSSAGMFKGGLANQNEKTIKLHTAHHLLLAALQEVLGRDVKQRGSNITEERLRIDFSFSRKLTAEEIKQVQDIVNKNIEEGHFVVRREMPRIEAETLGAEMEFGAKYPDVVSIYFIEDKDGNVISKEFCGGPHVDNTKDLGNFSIVKEEAVSAGVRRIKAILS